MVTEFFQTGRNYVTAEIKDLFIVFGMQNAATQFSVYGICGWNTREKILIQTLHSMSSYIKTH